MATQENLISAFAGESQANRKYLAFARKAEKEGKKGLAQLFRVVAEGETIHALGHLEVAGGVSDSLENVKKAIKGETYEFTTMYPSFLEEAEKEGNTGASIGFHRANEVEKEHGKLFQEALDKNGDIEEKEYYLCEICGHIEIGGAPEKCPVCGVPKDRFRKID
ncbi:MAG: rubrerythrin [uncultured bacterium]|nr:MAG: rubrerythrin [uncultured bacterium]HCU70977.1 rubrerythrin [Candidatus Moranbacteria bacterium]